MHVAYDLHNESETALFELWRRRGDERAQAELVNRHLPLVRQLARRYSYTSEPLDDLVQVGSVGLLHALARYDAHIGPSFKAYAVPTILGELRRHFRDTAWSVHLPRSLQERTRAVQAAVSALQATLGRSQTIAEIGERIGASSEQVLEAMEARLAYRVESLDAPAEPATSAISGGSPARSTRLSTRPSDPRSSAARSRRSPSASATWSACASRRT